MIDNHNDEDIGRIVELLSEIRYNMGRLGEASRRTQKALEEASEKLRSHHETESY